MSRFAFVTWDGGGNVPPAVGIAQELISRGHDVVFFGYEVQRAHFEARQLPFIVLPRSGSFDVYAVTDPSQRIPGLMTKVWAAPEHLGDIPEALAATSADVMVVDFMMQGALVAAHRSRTPFAVLAHSSIGGLIPPPESPMGAARLTATNRILESVDMPALERLNDAWIATPTLVTTIPELDPAAAGAESTVHYVGPIFERGATDEWASPWSTADDRPLVLVSFSTTGLWDQGGRIGNTLEALTAERVRVLVSTSRTVDLGHVPSNAAVRPYVPHHTVMPSVAVTVTHAGHGTVTASLAHGVPLVALPNPAADQPFLAAELQRRGAGMALDGESNPDAIREAVRTVIEHPSYRASARDLAVSIRASPGPAGAAADLEELARTG